MKSPKDMRIIQIDITNACAHRCSNCTRFCGHYKKPFFMNFETFKRAVDSLDEFEGTVSMMGGEPTLHPEFERFARYLASKYPQYAETDRQMLHPQPDFMKAVQELELSHTEAFDAGGGIRQNLNGPGLWSAMGNSYKMHYELIQDIFKYQALNDHTNAMFHQPVLVSRKDLGIPDNEWIKLRDNCWVQNEWSASITPKGAFFCEIAGALDMLFDGPGGWPIEPGWWKREVPDFKDQLHWCELCGLACNTFSRDANEQIDDVSPTCYQELLKTQSPWMDHVKIVDIVDGQISKDSVASDKRFQRSMPYAENYQERFNSTESVLYPAAFDDHTWSEQTISKLIQKALYRTDRDHYIFLHSANIQPADGFFDKMKQNIFNPGTLIYSDDKEILQQLPDYFTIAEGTDGPTFAAIFSLEASSIREMGFDRIAKLKNVQEFVSLWDPHKVIPFDHELLYIPLETELASEKKYAIYGTGEHTEVVLNRLSQKGSECVLFVDSNTDRQGQLYHGLQIQAPDALIINRTMYDKVIIGSPRYYVQIVEKLMDMGFEKNELICSY